MKLKRICQLSYDDNDIATIPKDVSMRYDVYFIDNDDYFCIDEDDYTDEKMDERIRAKYKLYRDDGNGLQPIGKLSNTIYPSGFIYTPYIPLQNIKLEFVITKNGVSFK